MKGFGRKSSRQEPGEDKGCPLPSAPASVFYRIFAIKTQYCQKLKSYHEEAVPNPESIPTVGTVRDMHALTVDRNHLGF